MSNKRKEAPDSGIVQKAKKARLGEGHIGENVRSLSFLLLPRLALFSPEY